MNVIDGRILTSVTVGRMSNCRLKSARLRLQLLLSMVEDEIDNRLGKGGGGLK